MSWICEAYTSFQVEWTQAKGEVKAAVVKKLELVSQQDWTISRLSVALRVFFCSLSHIITYRY